VPWACGLYSISLKAALRQHVHVEGLWLQKPLLLPSAVLLGHCMSAGNEAKLKQHNNGPWQR
jgi:hypothetical protein